MPFKAGYNIQSKFVGVHVKIFIFKHEKQPCPKSNKKIKYQDHITSFIRTVHGLTYSSWYVLVTLRSMADLTRGRHCKLWVNPAMPLKARAPGKRMILGKNHSALLHYVRMAPGPVA